MSTLTRIDWLATFARRPRPLRPAGAAWRPARRSAVGGAAGAVADRRAALTRPHADAPALRTACRLRLRQRRRLAAPRPRGHGIEPRDQIAIAAGRLASARARSRRESLDAVDGGENERDGVGGDRHAVAELAHQGFGGMRQRLEPRQAEEAAGALDGVDEAKDVAEDVGVIRILFEAHQLDIDTSRLSFVSVRELPQQVVHTQAPRHHPHDAGGHTTGYSRRNAQKARAAVARRDAPERSCPVCCQRV